MKGVREPLLWIALASPLAFLPAPQLGLPISAALALSIQLLRRTRLGQQAQRQLLAALVLAWSACALQVSLLCDSMLHLGLPVPFFVIAAAPPLTLLAVAHALHRMADVAALDESALWFSASRLLFAGLIVLGAFKVDFCVNGGFLACPIFAYLVLRMRTEIALPDAR